MRTSPMQSLRRFGRALLAAPLVVAGLSCTELTEVPHDALTPDNAFKTEAELLAGVAAVYAGLRPIEWVGYVTLQDLTADVSIVPTRGSDWYDNGRWLEMHRQTWTENSGSALDDMNGAWNNLFAGIAKANLMIDVVTKAGGPNAPRTLAELRTLRVWYYYMLQDMFGGVPLVDQHSSKPAQVARATREEIFNFMESELIASVPDLPDAWPAAGYGRITKGAANAILASLYINAGVFKKSAAPDADQGINATGYNSCSGVTVTGGANACTAAINAANAVINSGQYSLAPNWRDNFDQDNHTSPENIFVIVYTAEGSQGLGGNWPFRTLHYNQLNSGWGSPWNGFATLAETYAQFEATDERRGMWLEGQAVSYETGAPVNDRSGNPLIFTAAIPDANQANEAHGVRFNKFPPIPSAPTGNAMPNDFPFFRLSEMYLIKAEAENEQAQTATARTTVATVHNLRNAANPVPAGMTQQAMRDYILRER
ncbi:MAG TPA: RagB/SusD family nutrient uptake outer membrane protein, partial [Gemmatimonadaceae bacterium]|nr:RagB/SusD family nutrient uptake outer membrane protein [Gemmatimonadaceae bacterium]